MSGCAPNFFEHGHQVLSLFFGNCSLICSACDDTVDEVSALLHGPIQFWRQKIRSSVLVVVMQSINILPPGLNERVDFVFYID